MPMSMPIQFYSALKTCPCLLFLFGGAAKECVPMRHFRGERQKSHFIYMAMAVYSTYKANDPRDASFSSYLDTAERDFVRTLAESIHSPSPGREGTTSTPHLRNRIPRTSHELGVFEADRYFNEKLDSKKTSTPNGGRGGGNNQQRQRREKTSSGIKRSPTPSLKSSSEASWNSQLGFRILSGFQCKGSCFDKKSVHTAPLPYPPRKTNQQQQHFSFPIIDTASASPQKYIKIKTLNHDQPRKSLEVFGVHRIGKQEIADNLERKVSILSWDAIPNSSPQPFSFPNSKIRTSLSLKHQRLNDDLDARSDASSDLFEIEGITPTSTMSTPTRTHYYEPSEASIEWSVVTARAADHHNNHKKTGIFSGCRSHKAVDVCSRE